MQERRATTEQQPLGEDAGSSSGWTPGAAASGTRAPPLPERTIPELWQISALQDTSAAAGAGKSRALEGGRRKEDPFILISPPSWVLVGME